jgi:hypothetical protein
MIPARTTCTWLCARLTEWGSLTPNVITTIFPKEGCACVQLAGGPPASVHVHCTNRLGYAHLPLVPPRGWFKITLQSTRREVRSCTVVGVCCAMHCGLVFAVALPAATAYKGMMIYLPALPAPGFALARWTEWGSLTPNVITTIFPKEGCAPFQLAGGPPASVHVHCTSRLGYAHLPLVQHKGLFQPILSQEEKFVHALLVGVAPVTYHGMMIPAVTQIPSVLCLCVSFGSFGLFLGVKLRWAKLRWTKLRWTQRS